MEPGRARHKRSFNLPAGNRRTKLVGFVAELFRAAKSRRELFPIRRNERQEKLSTTVFAKLPRSEQEVIRREVVPLKIDPAVAVDLHVKQRRRDP